MLAFSFKLGVSESNENQTVTLKGFVIPNSVLHLGVVNKLRLQKEGGRYIVQKYFLSTIIRYRMSKEGGRWSKKGKNLSM